MTRNQHEPAAALRTVLPEEEYTVPHHVPPGLTEVGPVVHALLAQALLRWPFGRVGGLLHDALCCCEEQQVVVSDQPVQELRALLQCRLLQAGALSSVGAVCPVEGRQAVHDQQAERGVTTEQHFQRVQREQQLRAATAVQQEESPQAELDGLLRALRESVLQNRDEPK